MSGIYVEFGDVTVVEGAVSGLGAAVVALVTAAVIRVGSRVIHTPAAFGLAAVAFLAIAVGVPFPVIIALAALLGYLAGRSNPRLLGRPAGHGSDEDDDDAAAQHIGVSVRRRFAKGLVIWLVPVAVLVLIGGLVGQLAGFFTVAALVTFGGAYAVLPFVANAAVNHYGWLTSKDMVAGLALGESTPGPLIMVNTFVGFVAGYNIGGNLAWGFLGAVIATLATFVPCFVLIISGAPIIDRIREHRQLRQQPQRHHHQRRRRDRRPRRVRRPPRPRHQRQRRLGTRRSRRGRLRRVLALPSWHHPSRAHLRRRRHHQHARQLMRSLTDRRARSIP